MIIGEHIFAGNFNIAVFNFHHVYDVQEPENFTRRFYRAVLRGIISANIQM